MSFMAGSVFANLVLDDSQWTEGIQKARKDLAQMGEKASKFGKDMADAGKKISVAGVAIVGAFGYMLKSAANAGDAIFKMSQKVGVSVKDLSSYRLAAELADTSLESLGTGLRILSMRMKDARDGSSEARQNFKELGVEVLNADGTLRSTNDVMLDVAEKFSKMEDGALKTALAQRTLGRSGTELIPLLNLGRKGLEENRKEAERLGLVFTEKTAKASEDFNDSLTRLSNSFLGLKQGIVTDLTPHLTKLIEGFKETVAKVTDWVKEHPKLTLWIAKTTLGLGALLAVLGPVVFVVGKLIQGIGGIYTGLSKLLPYLIRFAPLLTTIAAVGAAAFAGWKIGRAIGELTGLDKVLQSAFTSAFKFLGIIKETNIEMGEGHAKAAEIQQQAITRAMEMSGKSVKNFIEAKRILQAEWAKSGTVGSAALDSWLARLPKVEEKTAAVTKATDDYGLKVSSVKTALESLTKAADDTAEAFDKNIESIMQGLSDDIGFVEVEFDLPEIQQQTDAVASILSGLVDMTADKSKEVTLAINSTMESLRGPTTADIRQQIALISMTLEQFGSSMPTSRVKELEEEIRRLKGELGDVSPWEKFLQGAADAFQQIESRISPIIQQFQRNKEIAIENEYKKRLDTINKTIKDEEKKQKAITALEAEFEIKKTAARRSAAKTEKAVALMGAVINTAQAVTKALAQGGFILGIPWAAIIGAMGAVQVAAIAAQPIPLAEGATFDKPTLLQNVLVGEKRPEYLLDRPKLIDIVRDALAMPVPVPVPALAGAQAAGGMSVSVSINGPLIQTSGVSRQDLWAAGEELVEVIDYQLGRLGRRS